VISDGYVDTGDTVRRGKCGITGDFVRGREAALWSADRMSRDDRVARCRDTDGA
jgi:hypothetical protein